MDFAPKPPPPPEPPKPANPTVVAVAAVLLFPASGCVGAAIGFGAAVGRAVFVYMGG